MEPPLPALRRRLPDLVAHRGYAARYPENTAPAIEAAIAAGARFVEVDVQVSSDERPVLFHDRTLQRMCGVPRAVHELRLTELRFLACAEREKFGDRFAVERIAELDDLVRILVSHPGVFAFVEMKRLAIGHFGPRKVLDIVLPRLEPVRERVALISFSKPFLAVARQRAQLPIGAVFDKLSEHDAPDARALEAEYVFCDVEGLPPAGPLRAGASKLAVYEVAAPRLALELAERGVDLVETFEIGEMVAALRGFDTGTP